MERVLNSIRLNSVFLNGVMPLLKRGQGGGGGSGGGGDVPDVPIEPDVPSGYEVFFASDGPFLAADGDFYVKM